VKEHFVEQFAESFGGAVKNAKYRQTTGRNVLVKEL
jgi:hypothetical protein